MATKFYVPETTNGNKSSNKSFSSMFFLLFSSFMIKENLFVVSHAFLTSLHQHIISLLRCSVSCLSLLRCVLRVIYRYYLSQASCSAVVLGLLQLLVYIVKPGFCWILVGMNFIYPKPPLANKIGINSASSLYSQARVVLDSGRYEFQFILSSPGCAGFQQV